MFRKFNICSIKMVLSIVIRFLSVSKYLQDLSGKSVWNIDVNEDIVRMLKSKAPVVCYTAIDSNSIKLDLDIDGNHILSHVFRLGEEQEMEKRDGSKVFAWKVKMTYSLEGENILKQVIKMSDGKTAYFIREFKDNEVKMTVTMDGTDVSASIYYEIIE